MRGHKDERNYVAIAGLCQLPQALKTVWSDFVVRGKVWSDLSKDFMLSVP